MGDFNPYIPNNAFHYIEGDELDKTIALPVGIYHPDIPLKRNTVEFREVSHDGKFLLEICKSVSARILNGRLVGDSSARFTSSLFIKINALMVFSAEELSTVSNVSVQL